MQNITWSVDGYRFDGEPKPFITGEFHYFRVPKKDWEERLRKLKEGGAVGVATYIPWGVHETEEGNIRFDDRPERDISDFLTLCRKLELAVVVRPGPYVYSEMVYNGLPYWIIDNYQEIIAVKANGSKNGRISVSYLHPLFLEKLRPYYRAVANVLKPFLPENGGPLCIVQIDNELNGIQVWNGSIDYHPVTMGFGKEDGRYTKWLKKRYSSIEELNRAYNRNYTDFIDVRPVDDESDKDGYHGGKPHNIFDARRNRDYADFYHEALAEYMCILGGWLREDGITVPFCHNAPYTEMVPDYVECVEKLDFLMGVDLYYSLGLGSHQNNPTPQYATSVLMAADYLKELNQPPTVFELQGGNCFDFPPVLPEDIEACYMTNTAFGMKGMNYYVFTGGPNFGNTGITCDIYDYHALISADNVVRPTYYAMARHNAAAHEHSWLQTATSRMANVSVGFAWEDHRWDEEQCGCYSDPGGIYNPALMRRFTRYGLIFSLMGSGFLPEMHEIGNGLPLEQVAIIPCSMAMTADKQRKLVEFLQNGGKAIFMPVVPIMDERYNPCTILSDALGIGEILPAENRFSRLRMDDGSVFHMITRQFTTACDKGKAIAFNNDSNQAIAYEIPVGKGTAVWLGAEWEFKSFEQQQLLVKLCRRLGGEDLIRSNNPSVWATVWQKDDKACVFLLNLLSGAQDVKMSVRLKGGWRELGNIHLPAMTVKIIDL